MWHSSCKRNSFVTSCEFTTSIFNNCLWIHIKNCLYSDVKSSDLNTRSTFGVFVNKGKIEKCSLHTYGSHRFSVMFHSIFLEEERKTWFACGSIYDMAPVLTHTNFIADCCEYQSVMFFVRAVCVYDVSRFREKIVLCVNALSFYL